MTDRCLDPNGCKRCGRLDCDAASTEEKRLALAQKGLESREYLEAQSAASTALFSCKIRGRVDWQKEMKKLVEAARNLERAITTRQTEAERDRIDVELRALRAAMPKEPK